MWPMLLDTTVTRFRSLVTRPTGLSMVWQHMRLSVVQICTGIRWSHVLVCSAKPFYHHTFCVMEPKPFALYVQSCYELNPRRFIIDKYKGLDAEYGVLKFKISWVYTSQSQMYNSLMKRGFFLREDLRRPAGWFGWQWPGCGQCLYCHSGNGLLWRMRSWADWSRLRSLDVHAQLDMAAIRSVLR